MKKICKKVITTLLGMGMFISMYSFAEGAQPDMVSAINVMNYEYCSIIAHKMHIFNKKEFANLIVEMCKENSFQTIKYATDVRGYPAGLYLSIYLNEKDFKQGNCYMEIKYITPKYISSANIKDDEEAYQLFIDGNLVEWRYIQGNVINILIEDGDERLEITAFLFIDIYGLLQTVQQFW